MGLISGNGVTPITIAEASQLIQPQAKKSAESISDSAIESQDRCDLKIAIAIILEGLKATLTHPVLSADRQG
jgi:hypothetical protein